MDILIAVILGLVCGVGITLAVVYNKAIGTLRLDSSDPYEKPYIFLELNSDCGNFLKKKFVVLKVNPKPYISQN